MESKHYLSNGQACQLVQKVGNQYLVHPICIIDTYDGYNEILSSPTLVDEIYETAPIELLDEEYKLLLSRTERLNKELEKLSFEKNELSKEVYQLQNTKTDLTKCIVNRSDFKNADTITVMRKNDGTPRTITNLKKSFGGNIQGLKFYFMVSHRPDEDRDISCSLMYEYDKSWTDSQQIEREFGILINATDEEITEKALAFNHDVDKRAAYRWEQTPDKYLPEHLIELKRANKEKLQEKEIENVQQEIEKKQQTLKKLLDEKEKRNAGTQG